jgi:hypothetical protein
MNYNSLLNKGISKKGEYKQLLTFLKNKKPKDLDKTIQGFHKDTFNEIDCLKCANCCKTTSPAIYENDIDKMAKYLKIKPGIFIEKYLTIDTDNVYMFKNTPCPFLGVDNYCSIYESRPKACREYPHTDRKRFYQITNITYKNIEICPVVVTVLDKLKSHYQRG